MLLILPEASSPRESGNNHPKSQTGKLRLIIKLLVQGSQACVSHVLTPREVSTGSTAWSWGSDPGGVYSSTLTLSTFWFPLSPPPWPTTGYFLGLSLPSRPPLKEPGGHRPGSGHLPIMWGDCPSSQLVKPSPSPQGDGKFPVWMTGGVPVPARATVGSSQPPPGIPRPFWSQAAQLYRARAIKSPLRADARTITAAHSNLLTQPGTGIEGN